jgi:hypothetical protein
MILSLTVPYADGLMNASHIDLSSEFQTGSFQKGVSMARLITYRDFCDFPRMFVVEHEGQRYLFDGSYNDDLDEYPDDYDVFMLGEMHNEHLTGRWENLARHAVQHLGRVSTDEVKFDATRRNSIDHGVLAELARRHLVA